MADDFEHSRFLAAKDGAMHFGCINPFCRHGELGFPRHLEVPLETKSIRIKVISHKDRLITFEVFMKQAVGKHKSGETVKLTCADNLVACKSTFKDLFAEKVEAGKLKAGDVVMIYEDPVTEKKPEGKAKLIRKIKDVSEVTELWEVQFLDSISSLVHFPRLIKKKETTE